MFFAADVLTNGRVFVAGCEYGIADFPDGTAEIYDPAADAWTLLNIPTSILDPQDSPACNYEVFQSFADMISETLPDGSVLMAPDGPQNPGDTLIYHPASNTWSRAKLENGACNMDECSWAKLPDGSILAVDSDAETSERYIPSMQQWIQDADCPVDLWNNNPLGDNPPGEETGPAFMLPSGVAFWVGGNNNTALYYPSGNTLYGAWIAGPPLPDGLQ